MQRLLQSSPAWRSLAAQVRTKVVLDGVRMLSRPGPLLADTLEAMVEAMHPGLTHSFGHRGTMWAMV